MLGIDASARPMSIQDADSEQQIELLEHARPHDDTKHLQIMP